MIQLFMRITEATWDNTAGIDDDSGSTNSLTTL